MSTSDPGAHGASGRPPVRPVRLARWVAGGLAQAAIAGLLLVALAITIDVCLRYFLARPIRGFFDLQGLAFAVLLAACMPLALAERSHIAVTVLGDRIGGRIGRALDRFGRLVTVLFFAVMAWQYLRFAGGLAVDGERMAVLRWVVWPWWAAVAGLIVVATLVGAATLLAEDAAALDDIAAADSGERR